MSNNRPPTNERQIHAVKNLDALLAENDSLKDQLSEMAAEAAKWKSRALNHLRAFDELEHLFKELREEYRDRKCQWGDEYLWSKHEDSELIAKVEAYPQIKEDDQ